MISVVASSDLTRSCPPMTHSEHVPGCVLSRKDTIFEPDHACLREAVSDGSQRAAYFWFPSYLLIDDSEFLCAFTWHGRGALKLQRRHR